MILDADGLEVTFATSGGPLRAVRGISFSVDEGEIVGVVGESGSGKSVTAHSILRLLPANGEMNAGTIRFRGDDIAGYTDGELRAFRGNNVAMIFQEPGRSFDPIYTIGRSLAETLRAHQPNMTDDEVLARSITLLEEVHVQNPAGRLGNFPHQFSGGLLQRIMIAHALAGDPDLLIADEPTTALDVTIQAGIIELLLELRRRRGLAILFITHNLALISGFADRLVVMYGGLVMEQGPARAVLDSPRHPYTSGLLQSLVPFGLHHSTRPLVVLAGSPPDPLDPPVGCPFAPRCERVQVSCTTDGGVQTVREGNRAYRCVAPVREGVSVPGADSEAEAE